VFRVDIPRLRRNIRDNQLRIGILGGTGKMGSGLALRLSLKHDVVVGSRSVEKAEAAACELREKAEGFYQSAMRGSIMGVLNEDAVEDMDIVIDTLPASAAVTTLIPISNCFKENQIVVSCVVPMQRSGRLFTWSPVVSEGCTQARSAAEFIQDATAPAKVVSAFQTIPAQYLNDVNGILDLDVLVAGNDKSSVDVIISLVRDIPGLRPLKVGPLENSKWVESLTPLLLNASILNKLHDPSIRIVPWTPDEETLALGEGFEPSSR
jgi:NADPH-dependent F420 reductase